MNDGTPLPLGATAMPRRRQFRARRTQRHGRGAVPVRRHRRPTQPAPEAAGPDRRRLAHPPAGRPARPGLRLARLWPLVARRGAALQPPPSCCSTPTPRRTSSASSRGAPELFGYTVGHPDGDLSFDERDSAPFVPKCVVVDSRFQWTLTDARARALEPDRVLRDARARLHHEAPQGARAVPRHLRRPGARRGDRPRSRNWASTSVELLPVQMFLNQPLPHREGPDQLLGLRHHRLLRARPALHGRPEHRRVQEHGRPLPRPRAGSDHGRGLQPHARRQRDGPDASPSRASTTPATTACCPTSRATTSTTRAPATR